LPRLGVGEEFTGLIFSDSIQNGSYVCKIPKVHNLNNNPFRTLSALSGIIHQRYLAARVFKRMISESVIPETLKDPAFRRPSIDRPAVGRFDGNCTNTLQFVPSFVFLISIDFDGKSISRTDLYVKEILTTVELLNADRSQSPFVGKSAVPCGFWETMLLQGRCVCIVGFIPKRSSVIKGKMKCADYWCHLQVRKNENT